MQYNDELHVPNLTNKLRYQMNSLTPTHKLTNRTHKPITTDCACTAYGLRPECVYVYALSFSFV